MLNIYKARERVGVMRQMKGWSWVWFVVCFVSSFLLLNHVGVLVCDRGSHSPWHQERLSLGEGAKRHEEPYYNKVKTILD